MTLAFGSFMLRVPPSLPPVALFSRGAFSTDTSEKVFVLMLRSGVPVATNWDA